MSRASFGRGPYYVPEKTYESGREDERHRIISYLLGEEASLLLAGLETEAKTVRCIKERISDGRYK